MSKYDKLSSRPATLEKPTLTSTKKLMGAMLVPIKMLVPAKIQVRKSFPEEALQELAADIKERGILEPILVREDEEGNYEIIAGERRYRAAKLAGLNEVPVIVKTLEEKELRFTQLAENLQRQDLNPIEEREAFVQLQAEFNLSITALAKMVNKSRDYVRDRIEGNLKSISGVRQKRELLKNSRIVPKAQLKTGYFVKRSHYLDEALEILDLQPLSTELKIQLSQELETLEEKITAVREKLKAKETGN